MRVECQAGLPWRRKLLSLWKVQSFVSIDIMRKIPKPICHDQHTIYWHIQATAIDEHDVCLQHVKSVGKVHQDRDQTRSLDSRCGFVLSLAGSAVHVTRRGKSTTTSRKTSPRAPADMAASTRPLCIPTAFPLYCFWRQLRLGREMGRRIGIVCIL